ACAFSLSCVRCGCNEARRGIRCRALRRGLDPCRDPAGVLVLTCQTVQSSIWGVPRIPARSELKSAFPGGVAERVDAPMIEISAAIEDDLRDAGGLCALGDELANLDRRLLVGGARQLSPFILLA